MAREERDLRKEYPEFYETLHAKYPKSKRVNILDFQVQIVKEAKTGSVQFNLYDPARQTGDARGYVTKFSIAPELRDETKKATVRLPHPDQAILFKLADTFNGAVKKHKEQAYREYAQQLVMHPDNDRIRGIHLADEKAPPEEPDWEALDAEEEKRATYAPEAAASSSSSAPAKAHSQPPTPSHSLQSSRHATPTHSRPSSPVGDEAPAAPHPEHLEHRLSVIDKVTRSQIEKEFEDSESTLTTDPSERVVDYAEAIDSKMKDMRKSLVQTGQFVGEQYRGMKKSINEMKDELSQMLATIDGTIQTSTGEQVGNTAQLQRLLMEGQSAMKLETLKNEPLTLVATILGLDAQGDFTEADKMEISDKASALTQVDFAKIRDEAEQAVAANAPIADPRARNKAVNDEISQRLKAVAEKTRGEIRDMAKTVLQKRGAKIFTPKTQSLKSKRKMLEKIKIK